MYQYILWCSLLLIDWVFQSTIIQFDLWTYANDTLKSCTQSQIYNERYNITLHHIYSKPKKVATIIAIISCYPNEYVSFNALTSAQPIIHILTSPTFPYIHTHTYQTKRLNNITNKSNNCFDQSMISNHAKKEKKPNENFTTNPLNGRYQLLLNEEEKNDEHNNILLSNHLKAATFNEINAQNQKYTGDCIGYLIIEPYHIRGLDNLTLPQLFYNEFFRMRILKKESPPPTNLQADFEKLFTVIAVFVGVPPDGPSQTIVTMISKKPSPSEFAITSDIL